MKIVSRIIHVKVDRRLNVTNKFKYQRRLSSRLPIVMFRGTPCTYNKGIILSIFWYFQQRHYCLFSGTYNKGILVYFLVLPTKVLWSIFWYVQQRYYCLFSSTYNKGIILYFLVRKTKVVLSMSGNENYHKQL